MDAEETGPVIVPKSCDGQQIDGFGDEHPLRNGDSERVQNGWIGPQRGGVRVSGVVRAAVEVVFIFNLREIDL